MKIKSFYIDQFRALKGIRVDVSDDITGFWGDNGQGKTSVLEAVYGALRGQSFRPYVSVKDWAPHHLDYHLSHSRIEILLEDERHYQAHVVLEKTDKWSVYLNGKKTTYRKIRSRFPLIVFSPDDHQLIRGGPELRRDFLDQLFVDICPGYEETWGRFQKALKNRNKVLKTIKDSDPQELLSFKQDRLAELTMWDRLFAQEASELMFLRHELWPQLVVRVHQTLEDLHRELCERVEVRYITQFIDMSPQGILEKLKQSLKVDVALGWTRYGPHRDDFTMLIDEQPSKQQASQGQAKILALALRWTHALWLKNNVERPIFIIDDLSNELDAGRRKRLIEHIFSLDAQLLVSGTDPAIFNSAISIKRPLKELHYGLKNATLTPYTTSGVMHVGESKTSN